MERRGRGRAETGSTMPTQDIIVGSAGTREGRAALDWALRRAERTTTPVTVLYIADPDSTHDRPDLTTAAESHGELVLERDAFLASTKAPHATVSTVVERGRPSEMLAGRSPEGSLLVLGAHDALSRISPYFSPIIDTVSLARCPVVVVPVRTQEPRPEVVVGFGSQQGRGSALDMAAAEASALQCTLVVVHARSPLELWIPGFVEPSPGVADLAAASLHVLDSAVEPYRRLYPELRIETVAVGELPATALRRRATDATLLVLDPGRHGALASALLGSVVRDLIMDPPCPTMVVPLPPAQD
jgi:nucleotide-binding universal stress UspA family protein